MPVMEISVVPLGTATPSVSHYVAACVKLLRGQKNIKYTLTAMGTIVEADSTAKLLSIAGKMHKTVLRGDIKRVVTSIKIDDRRDKELTMEGKLNTVRKKIK